MKAYILSIGTELIMGELVDTNAPYIASKLPSLGIELIGISQVGDNIEALSKTLQNASSVADIIFTTGGLGPTEDDLTRESIASLLDEKPYVDPKSLEVLKQRFIQRNIPMPDGNLKQATLINSSKSIPNINGTAPGWWVTKNNKIIVAMPGPPSEMRSIWEKEVVGNLLSLKRGQVTVTKTLKTFGAGEGLLNEKVAHLFHLHTVNLGMYAQAQGVHLRIRANGKDYEKASELIRPVEKEIKSILGGYIWGEDDQDLEEQIGLHLTALGLTLATMESCTGGFLAHTITQVSGSSGYFKGGYVSYNNSIKTLLGVSQEVIEKYGVISTEVAESMAIAIKEYMGTDIGIGITGVAGVDYVERNRPGTVHIGISLPSKTISISKVYTTQRQNIKQRATMDTLLELWNQL
jgi:nicotinamide-nucleotide amidase